MLEPPLISVPLDPSVRPESPWSTSSQTAPRELSAPPRFPHTRAQLTAIARQYRPDSGYDDEFDNDDTSPVTTALVARVASLLSSEHEDELKTLLKSTFGPGIDDDEVSVLSDLIVTFPSSLSISCPNTS